MRRSIQYNFCYNKKIFGLCFGKNSETIYKNDGGTIGSDGLTVGIYTKKGAPPSPNLC